VRFVYTNKQIEFLKANYPRLSLEDLARTFNDKFSLDKTVLQIRAACKNHSIRCGRRAGQITGSRFSLLTVEQIDFLKEKYPLMSRANITLALNNRFGLSLRLTQIVAYTKNHGIKSGRSGRFEKGAVSHNAGTKGLMKPNSGSFQKGNAPHNAVAVGATTKDGDGYHKIKIAEPNVWEFTHRRMYRQKHGAIASDSAVVFIDGNRDNLSIENLELIHRGELAVRNKFGVSLLPAELRPIGAVSVKLRMKACSLKRNKRKSACIA